MFSAVTSPLFSAWFACFFCIDPHRSPIDTSSARHCGRGTFPAGASSEVSEFLLHHVSFSFTSPRLRAQSLRCPTRFKCSLRPLPHLHPPPPPPPPPPSMALQDPDLLRIVHSVTCDLDASERRRVLFLCESPEADSSAACVSETLRTKALSHGHLFLAEVVLELRRFDLLRKVFRSSRSDVERAVRSRQVLSRFRVLMDNISEDLTSEDLKSVKFLLSHTLPQERMEKVKNFLDLVTELEKLDKVSSDRVDFVEECLRNVDRIDLVKKINKYKMSVGASERNPPQQPKARAPFLPAAATCCSYSIPPARVAQPCAYRQHSPQTQLDYYRFKSDPRGVCLIVDCVGNDGEMLENTFRSLHFDVVLHKWLNVADTRSALSRAFQGRENREGDGFVCCIISRGIDSQLLATDTQGAGLHLDEVRRLFNGEECRALAGKPKMFFIQSYGVQDHPSFARQRYYDDDDLETDGCNSLPLNDCIPKDADVFWSHCRTDEQQLQQGDHRSVYLKALTDVLLRGQKRKRHLVEAHIEVNDAVYRHNSSNPREEYCIELRHTLRKELYL